MIGCNLYTQQHQPASLSSALIQCARNQHYPRPSALSSIPTVPGRTLVSGQYGQLDNFGPDFIGGEPFQGVAIRQGVTG